MQVQGNSFLVTGGASGLGEAVVRAITKQGGNVIIADLNADARKRAGCSCSFCTL